MKAAIFKAAGEPLVIETIPDPTPGEGEVVIRVSRCGVCGTDLHATSGHGLGKASGTLLGHEYAGEVVAIGRGVTSHRLGDRVAGLPVLGCGQCQLCQSGLDILCGERKSFGEGMAQYARLGARAAFTLPADFDLADGALIEPLAVARRAVRLAAPPPDARVLVMGPGPIGLSVLFWLRRAGVERVAVLASSHRRRALAMSMGTPHFVVESDAAEEEIKAALGGAPTIIFEAAGVPGVLGRAVKLIHPQGLVMALGFGMAPDPLIPAAALMKDATLRFSVTYTRDDYSDCVTALQSHGAEVRALVTQTTSLSGFPEAFEAFRNGSIGGGKLLVDPWAE